MGPLGNRLSISDDEQREPRMMYYKSHKSRIGAQKKGEKSNWSPAGTWG